MTKEPAEQASFTASTQNYDSVSSTPQPSESSADSYSDVIRSQPISDPLSSYLAPNEKNEITQTPKPVVEDVTQTAPPQQNLFEAVSSQNYLSNYNNQASYVKEKSIEQPLFTEFNHDLFSEVQKHVDQVILKDLRKEHRTELPTLTTVTEHSITITSNGDSGLLSNPSTTLAPEVTGFALHSSSSTENSIENEKKIYETNDDQISKDTANFGVSLSPSFTTSVNVSEAPHELIEGKSAKRNSNSSRLCKSDLCEEDSNQISSDSLVSIKPKENIGSETTISSGGKPNKLIQAFYPPNPLSAERHFVTTIDVQKGISLEVQQNEDGSIQLARNFPFNKLSSHQRQQSVSTARPILNNDVTFGVQNFENLYVPSSVTPSPTPSFISVTSTTPVSPTSNFLITNQNLYQNDFNNNHLGQGTPVYPSVTPQTPLSTAAYNYLINANTQHQSVHEVDLTSQNQQSLEKQKFIEEERRQYLENLERVEKLKEQDSHRSSLNIHSNALVQKAIPSIIPVNFNSISPVSAAPDLLEAAVDSSAVQVPINSAAAPTSVDPGFVQTPAVGNSYAQYQSSVQYAPDAQGTNYQTNLNANLKNIPLSYYGTQDPNIYAKNAFSYNILQSPYQNGFYKNLQNVFLENSAQPTAAVQNVPTQLPAYVPIPSLSFDTTFSVPPPVQSPEKAQQYPLIQGQGNNLPVNIPYILPQNKLPESARALPINPLGSVNSLIHNYQSYSLQIPPQPQLQPQPQPQPQLQPQLQSQHLRFPAAAFQYSQQYRGPVVVPTSKPSVVLYPQVTPSTRPGYHVTESHRATNKLRVQPLKPSPPDEETNPQSENFRGFSSQQQFTSNLYYGGFPANNRVQLRHIPKSHVSNADQIASQTSVRKSKSLSNLRIEYGFKPPLRPSVEFTEEVKPSIYGPSIPPQ